MDWRNLTPAQHQARISHGRKLDSFEHAFHHPYNKYVIPRWVHEQLPRLYQEKLNGPETPLTFNATVKETGIFILVLKDGREVIVNTEGFDYCRYCSSFRVTGNLSGEGRGGI